MQPPSPNIVYLPLRNPTYPQNVDKMWISPDFRRAGSGQCGSGGEPEVGRKSAYREPNAISDLARFLLGRNLNAS